MRPLSFAEEQRTHERHHQQLKAQKWNHHYHPDGCVAHETATESRPSEFSTAHN